MTRFRLSAALALALLGACDDGPSPSDSEAYGKWQPRNVILAASFGGGEVLPCSITFDVEGLGRKPGDWLEVTLNGIRIGRIPTTDRSGAHTFTGFKLRPGPNWIRFFSSAQDQGFEFQVDSRSGTILEFTRSGEDWEMDQAKDE